MQRLKMIQKYMKSHDRIVFIDFGIGIDDESLDQCFNHTRTWVVSFSRV